jgi:hypothetical protein
MSSSRGPCGQTLAERGRVAKADIGAIRDILPRRSDPRVAGRSNSFAAIRRPILTATRIGKGSEMNGWGVGVLCVNFGGLISS